MKKSVNMRNRRTCDENIINIHKHNTMHMSWYAGRIRNNLTCYCEIPYLVRPNSAWNTILLVPVSSHTRLS